MKTILEHLINLCSVVWFVEKMTNGNEMWSKSSAVALVSLAVIYAKDVMGDDPNSEFG